MSELTEAVKRATTMMSVARIRAKDAQAHAKRNKDSRNADRARHWQSIADDATAEAEALDELITVAVTGRSR